MKSIFKILILGVVPILMAAAVVDQGLAADKGSQLIFQSNIAHKNYIAVTNTADKMAVTVLTQYYNDEMELVLWYLRVIPGGGTVLIDPFDHTIPGTADDDGMNYTSVSSVLDALPDMSTDKKPGMNSGHFVIAVAAVGASVGIDTNDDGDDINLADERNQAETANILFPTFLAEDMHATDNIDNCGALQIAAPTGAAAADNLGLTRHPSGDEYDCRKAMADSTIPADTTSKNVGDLDRDNAQPISFNHLTGSFTEALTGTAAGGADQTASWGGTPVIRPAVADADNMGLARDVDTEQADAPTNSDYQVLNGMDEDDSNVPTADASGLDGGRLAEKDAGGMGKTITNTDAREAYTEESDISTEEEDATNRGLDGGALVLPSLYGGGDETQQIMLLLSAADDFGGPGKYMLIPAMTGYKVVLMDNMGNMLEDPASDSGLVFGGTDDPSDPVSVNIIVDGIRVMTNADLGECTGTMSDTHRPWMLADLTSLVPEASSGKKDFAGLDAMQMPSMNASVGWIKFMRSALTCKENYGDGDSPQSPIEDNDGVPTKEERTYMAGTLIEEQKDSTRSFVTTGQALLKFITPSSTFAASWSLKSPPSMPDPTP